MKVRLVANVCLNGVVLVDDVEGKIEVLTERSSVWGIGEECLEDGQKADIPPEFDRQLFLEIAARQLVAQMYEALQDRIGKQGVFIPVNTEPGKKEDVN